MAVETMLTEANRQMETTKKCPYCAEQIQSEAIKCRFCGEFLSSKPPAAPRTKWYYNTSAVVIAILCIGPLALPLVWFNPRYNIITKVITTLVVIAGTVALTYLSVQAYVSFMKQFEQLGVY
jgi:hypothetical protein